MLVKLECVYGDKAPKDNPHEIEDEIAEKLIKDGLAIEVKKQGRLENSSELVAKDEEIASLNEKLIAKDEELLKMSEVIADLVSIVEETSQLPKGQVPDGFSKYKGE